MRRTAMVRLSVIVLAALTILTIGVRSTLRVEAAVPPAAVAVAPVQQMGGMGGGGAVEPDREPPTRVYFAAPVTAEAARTWIKLHQKIDVPFANETPLEDVVEYLKDVTRDKDDDDHGLSIYVDPLALQAAEKSLQTPVQLELHGIPLATTLTLILKQLGLTYHVQDDGIVIITGVDSEQQSAHGDPSKLILDRLSRLQDEVAALRSEMSRLRGPRSMPGGMGGLAPATRGTGGGFQ